MDTVITMTEGSSGWRRHDPSGYYSCNETFSRLFTSTGPSRSPSGRRSPRRGWSSCPASSSPAWPATRGQRSWAAQGTLEQARNKDIYSTYISIFDLSNTGVSSRALVLCMLANWFWLTGILKKEQSRVNVVSYSCAFSALTSRNVWCQVRDMWHPVCGFLLSATCIVKFKKKIYKNNKRQVCPVRVQADLP